MDSVHSGGEGVQAESIQPFFFQDSFHKVMNWHEFSIKNNQRKKTESIQGGEGGGPGLNGLSPSKCFCFFNTSLNIISFYLPHFGFVFVFCSPGGRDNLHLLWNCIPVVKILLLLRERYFPKQTFRLCVKFSKRNFNNISLITLHFHYIVKKITVKINGW